MSPEVGYFALLLALFVSVTQSAMPFVAARRREWHGRLRDGNEQGQKERKITDLR